MPNEQSGMIRGAFRLDESVSTLEGKAWDCRNRIAALTTEKQSYLDHAKWDTERAEEIQKRMDEVNARLVDYTRALEILNVASKPST